MWAIIPFGEGLAIFDYSLGILYTLALSSLGVTGFLILQLISLFTLNMKNMNIKVNNYFKLKKTKNNTGET